MSREPKFLTGVCSRCGAAESVVNYAWLRARRLRAGISLRDFAKSAAVSAAHICHIEHGRRYCLPAMREHYEALRLSDELKGAITVSGQDGEVGMSETQQSKFDGWAIVDVLGHQRYVGYVTTEAFGAAVLFRIDVPALDERERATVRPGYVGDAYVPAGTVVKEGAVAGYTKLIGAGSIYAITPCSKDAALKAVEDGQPRPLMGVTLPEGRALSAPFLVDEDDADKGDELNDDAPAN